jgi:hypothetical protein
MNDPKPHEAAAPTMISAGPSVTPAGRFPGSRRSATPANPASTPSSVPRAIRSCAAARNTMIHSGTEAISTAASPDGT